MFSQISHAINHQILAFTQRRPVSFRLLPCVLGALLCLLAGCESEEQQLPNILIVVADDLGWGDVGYNGSEIRTPEIDRLAVEGVKLERFYAHPICSPTRSALMTGRSPLKTGVLVPFDPGSSKGLPLDEKLLPQYFKEAGYQTFAVGKWHLGPNDVRYWPQNRGFDSFYGHINGFINHYLHTFRRAVDWQHNGKTVHDEGYSTHLIADQAVRHIEQRDKDKPMLLYVSFSAPHTPLQAPEKGIAAYSDIEDENRRILAAMVTEMDRGIARIMIALEEQQLSENTLVLFMSDNGGALRSGANNGLFRGGKGSIFEGGIRVPAIVHWPAKVPSNTSFKEILTVEDILTTLLGAAQIPAHAPKPLDGRNMWPALSAGEKIEPGEAVLTKYGRNNYNFAFFKDGWKLTQRELRETSELEHQLFRISDDPYEKNDLASQHSDVVAEMLAQFKAIPKGDVIKFESNVMAKMPVTDGPGVPWAVLPDNHPPDREPYTETALGK